MDAAFTPDTITMTTDYRALCSALLDEMPHESPATCLARAALAEPEAVEGCVAELKAALERERLRLAACGVVAMADTPEAAARARDIHPDYRSASLDDVIRQVDALMELRSKLTQPEPVGPTPSDVTELFYRHMGEGSEVGFENAIAEAIARWGRPTIAPIPVSERLPGPEDCDAHGWCWVLYSPYATWTLEPPLDGNGQPCGWSHWLPAHALPLPSSDHHLNQSTNGQSSD